MISYRLPLAPARTAASWLASALEDGLTSMPAIVRKLTLSEPLRCLGVYLPTEIMFPKWARPHWARVPFGPGPIGARPIWACAQFGPGPTWNMFSVGRCTPFVAKHFVPLLSFFLEIPRTARLQHLVFQISHANLVSEMTTCVIYLRIYSGSLN